MAVQIKLRRGTTSEWSSANPILGVGEPGLDTTLKKVKYGDGTTAWNSLAFPEVGSSVDSATITQLIDSAYVQARQIDLYRDSAFVTSIIDAAYIQANQADIYRDSSFITGIIDAAYIQANQADIYRDSAFVTSIIDAAYIQANQSDIYRDSAFVTGIIDSNYINARVDAVSGGTIDSAQTISLITDTIDSNYINARVDAVSGTGTIDSAQTISLINDTVDSAHIYGILGILDGPIAAGLSSITEYLYIATQGQTQFSGSDYNGHAMLLDSGIPVVHINGIKMISSDYSITGNQLTLTQSADSSDEVMVEVYSTRLLSGGGGTGTVDSAQTISLITSTVDSDYISARVTSFIDGGSAITIYRDSDYAIDGGNA